MKIGELSRLTEVSRDTLRLYERRGLIRSERCANGYRDFDPDMVQVIRTIKLGQRLGFRLREMEDVIGTMTNRKVSAEDAADMLRHKISEVDVKIKEMSELRNLLVQNLERACPLRT